MRFATQAMLRPPADGNRRKDSTLLSASFGLIQRNPGQSKSCSHNAGSRRYTVFSARTNAWIPACSG